MKYVPRPNRFAARALLWPLLLCLSFVLAAGTVARAQTPATGEIAGRVLDVSTGNYVKRARVSVESANLETFTNEYGEFRLSGVPAGEARVKVFYTGLGEQAVTVSVPEGGTVRREIEFRGGAEDSIVQLGEFTVVAERETDMRSLAINERRFSANLKNVVSADEFGDVPEGNVGEFVKFLPGVSIDYTAADARTISVRGLPASNTPVMVDGNRMASAASSVATRTFELEQVSINNVSRVEVTKVPTPDQPADVLGGSVNLISKSAFERSKPEFKYRAYVNFNSESRRLDSVYAPANSPTHQVKPGFDFSYVMPVTKDFGFTINALQSNQYNPQFRSQMQWVPNNVGNATVPPENPYLSTFQISDVPKTTTRNSIGGTIDWRFRPDTTLTLSYQYNDYDAMFGGSNMTWAVGTNPVSWGPDFVQGRNGAGNVTIGTNFRGKTGATWQPSLKLRHEGKVWRADAGLYYSHASNDYHDMGKGFFENVSVRIPGVTVRLEGIGDQRVANPTATTTAGVVRDPFELDNYTILSARSSPPSSTDVQRGAHANVSRIVDLGIPVTLKTGFDVRENIRDIRYPQRSYTFVGADGRANTADDNAGFLANERRQELGAPYGYPAPEWPSTFLLYDLFVTNPSYFSVNEATAHTTAVRNSKKLIERVTAGYLRADVRLLENKLWLAGGVRYERTDDEGFGFLEDLRPIPGVTDPLERAQLQLQERANHVKKHYDDLFPSLNGTYSFTDNLLLRVGYAQSIGRPDYSHIIPGATIPLSTGTNPTITVSNTALKPWAADSYDVALQYYFKSNGILSVGVFQKDFSNFFGRTVQSATPELLEQYGLDPALAAEGYQISTMTNVGSARVSGTEFDYSQSLDALTSWLKGVSVFANGTFLHLEGQSSADFSGFIRRNVNWGVSYQNKRLKLSLNWNHRGRQRGAPVTTANVPDGTFEYIAPRLQLDVTAEYRIRRWLSIFGTARNVTDERLISQRYNELTPGYAYQFRDDDYGIQMTFGVKGTF